MALIDRQFMETPYYGSRKMTAWLRRAGHVVNRKRVRRLMRQMGLQVIWQKPNTSKPNPEHKVYPYLLRGLKIDRPNQVWATDITYIPMPKGFFYLVAIMDWHSRKVLTWRLSNTLEATFCVEALEEALATYGRPEIFNSDQGAQFTSTAFTGVLEAAAEAVIDLVRLARRDRLLPAVEGARPVLGVQGLVPAEADALLRRQAGVIVPAAVVILGISIREGYPDDLRHSVRQESILLFADSEIMLDALPIGDVDG